MNKDDWFGLLASIVGFLLIFFILYIIIFSVLSLGYYSVESQKFCNNKNYTNGNHAKGWTLYPISSPELYCCYNEDIAKNKLDYTCYDRNLWEEIK